MENKNKNTSNNDSISSKFLRGLFIIITFIAILAFVGVLFYKIIIYIDTGNFTFNFWKTLVGCLMLYGLGLISCAIIIAFKKLSHKLGLKQTPSLSHQRQTNKKKYKRNNNYD